MIPISQRIISLFIYMIPWSDALKYGSNIFNHFPIFKLFILPALPILFIKQSLYIGDFLILLCIFIGIVKNQKINYFLRLNAMQAILLNIILIIFYYLKILLIRVSTTINLIEILETTIFILSLTLIIFIIIQCLKGVEADIPGISNSAKIQI